MKPLQIQSVKLNLQWIGMKDGQAPFIFWSAPARPA